MGVLLMPAPTAVDNSPVSMPALPRTGIATVDAVDGEAAAVSVSVLAVSLLANYMLCDRTASRGR